MNYYNEFDPKAAAWLRELIAAGLIPSGDVDERSITEIKPYELTGYTQQHFFAGIGGWSLALILAGWPASRPVRTGSCPCQPFSVAGQGKGEADERHLWPVFRDLITFGEPTVTFGEQVASKDGRKWLAGIRADLEGLGYEVGAADLCAACAGSPHIRQRLFWVANAHGGNAGAKRQQRRREHGLQPQGRGSIGLANGSRERCAARSGTAGSETGEGMPWNESQSAGFSGRLADTAGASRAQQRDEPREGSRRGAGPNDAAECSGPCGVGNAHLSGRGEQRGPVTVPQELPAVELRGNAWDRYDILPCTDGKARRVESGTFPLAHGFSGRVGLLRGYGNAIVPQVAAQFIQAFQEVIGEAP